MRSTNKATVREIIKQNHWTRIGETEWKILGASVPNLVTANLHDAGTPVDPPWEGVRQHTFEELESSLRAFTDIYAGREDLRQFCRAEVIRAKDHARLAARNSRVSRDKRKLKQEMVDWMLVWLDDPAMFPAWAAMRVRYSQRDACADLDSGNDLHSRGGEPVSE